VAIEFRGSHFEWDVILCGVRWYVAYPISYRQLEEMMYERGVEVDHSTPGRWVLKYAPLLEQEFRARKRQVDCNWRMDETYVKVKGIWKYLYRAVDKAGATVDFLLTAKRIVRSRCASCARRSVSMVHLRRSQSTKAGRTRRRSKATTRNTRRVLRFVRSDTSPTSSSRTIEPSSDWFGQCWGSSPFGQPWRPLPVSNSRT
jgi:transposase-like protein